MPVGQHPTITKSAPFNAASSSAALGAAARDPVNTRTFIAASYFCSCSQKASMRMSVSLMWKRTRIMSFFHQGSE